MKVFVALPVMDESVNLPRLLKDLSLQKQQDVQLFVCVNQPDEWWDDEERKQVCLDNEKSIKILSLWKDSIQVHVIDRTSKGNGWKAKHYGVGWARKTAMDAINEVADEHDIIVSIDADTYYPSDYLQSVVLRFKRNPQATGLANPYYHQLINNNSIDHAILRYEIYMRNYSINMLLINNPYAFTAIGSAMALPVWAYRKINGITPHKSGEDFYLLQKLRKTGKLLVYNDVPVYPSSRPSKRVFFGTGPAIIKGMEGNWNSYPLYHHMLFREVKKTFDSFNQLFQEPLSSSMISFLNGLFKEKDFAGPLRKNSRTVESFMEACISKVDALRILQYLKSAEKEANYSDEGSLADNYSYFGLEPVNEIAKLGNGFKLQDLTVTELSEIRDQLFNLETQLQQKIYFPG